MRFRAGQMALTIWGWTPGLCETVGGRVLACGCLVGKYETWNGQIVELSTVAASAAALRITL